MSKHKKIKNKYAYLIIVLVSILLFISMMFFIRDQRKPTKIEQSMQDLVIVLKKTVSFPVQFVMNQIDKNREKNKIYQNYKNLQQEVDQLQAEQAKNQELESQLIEMKSLLELNQIYSDDQMIYASVVVRNLDSWYQTIIIDKGKNDGIEEGMAVIVSQGMIGQVLYTSKHSSTVKLLTGTDSNHKISVKIESNGNYIYGILSNYDMVTKRYQIEGIAENTEIAPNAMVVTTGFGGHISPGILIGTVDEIQVDHFDLARTVWIKASVDFDHIRYVTVLQNKEVAE